MEAATKVEKYADLQLQLTPRKCSNEEDPASKFIDRLVSSPLSVTPFCVPFYSEFHLLMHVPPLHSTRALSKLVSMGDSLSSRCVPVDLS